MSDKKKVSVTINYSIVQIVLIVLSILLSTGVWQPQSGFFLWGWLTFSQGHILAPILTIIFIPLLWGMLCALLFIVFTLIVAVIAYILGNS